MCHALVIEDEAIIAMMIERCLFEYGATSVDVAVSEMEAVASAQRKRPDFITSDVKLLEGTGPSAVAAITSLHGEIPLIFITGNPESCREYPSEAVLPKPVNAIEIGRRLEMACG